MKISKIFICGGLLCGLAVTSYGGKPAGKPSDVQSAVIQYLPQGNIQLDEGTLEMYVTAGFGTEDASRNNGNNSFPLFELTSPSTQERVFVFYLPSARRFVLVGALKPIQQLWVISRKEGIEGHHWKPNSHHVIAVTWKGRFRQFFVDGEPGEETEVEGPLSLDLAKTFMRLGSATNAPWTIDEFRISSVRRTPEELKEGVNKAPQADVYTLLLDHYDGDSPAISQGNPVRQSRQVEGKVQSVRERFGGALKLWSGN